MSYFEVKSNISSTQQPPCPLPVTISPSSPEVPTVLTFDTTDQFYPYLNFIDTESHSMYSFTLGSFAWHFVSQHRVIAYHSLSLLFLALWYFIQCVYHNLPSLLLMKIVSTSFWCLQIMMLWIFLHTFCSQVYALFEYISENEIVGLWDVHMINFTCW